MPEMSRPKNVGRNLILPNDYETVQTEADCFAIPNPTGKDTEESDPIPLSKQELRYQILSPTLQGNMHA
jgi:hypothetical protein